MSPSTQPVLDLDAELLDLEITFKATTYKLRSRAELSILELRRFRTVLNEYDELSKIEDEDEETAIKLGATLQEVAATLVVDAPEGGFHEQQCAKILSFWTEEHQKVEGPPTRRRPQDHQKKQPKNPAGSTGAK